MPVAGVEETADDFPGHLALFLALKGCNFRCEHCFVWNTISREKESGWTIQDFFRKLEKGSRLYSGVVISGGEPTVHPLKLLAILEIVRERHPDKRIKVYSNGSDCAYLSRLLDMDLFDAVSFSIKHPRDLVWNRSGKHYFEVLSDMFHFTKERRGDVSIDWRTVLTYNTERDGIFMALVDWMAREAGVEWEMEKDARERMNEPA